MYRRYPILFFTTVLFLVSATEYSGAQTSQQSLAGSWQGTLSVPGGSLRIVFNFKVTAAGKYAATFDSPDQGAFGIQTDSVVARDSLVRVPASSIRGLFEGIRPAGSDSIKGTWTQGGIAIPLVLHRTGKDTEGPKRPQEPKKPYPYREEEISFKNTDVGITLAGTLTLPANGGPFPAVVLITGSGPQDRDETIFAHKPFLILSDYLTRQGIAVLRYDDRGVGKSTGSFGTATSADFAGDAQAALAYLKTRKDIRTDRLGLIGHSEGGIIAPMIAARSRDVAFIVMMAGTGVPGDEIILEQATLIGKAMGVSEKQLLQAREINKKIYDLIKSGKDSATVTPQLRSLLAAATDTTKRNDATASNAAINAQIRQITSPWFRYFLAYDPRTALKMVHCPVLALNGEKDLQVPPRQNLPIIESTLRMGGNNDVTVREIPGLNHLFQAATTGAPSEYAKIEETISPAALKLIGDWILERCK